MTWNPLQYERFREERSQPFYDLLALVRPKPAMSVVDLGCGTGELTRELHVRLAAQSTLGIDAEGRLFHVRAFMSSDGPVLLVVEEALESHAAQIEN